MTIKVKGPITAARWNELLDELKPLLAGRVLGITTLGTRGVWRHPWFTTASWNAETRQFEARVNPGFVNGLDPLDLMERPLTDASAIPLTTWRTPGTGTGLAGFDPVPEFFIALGVSSGRPDEEPSTLPSRQLRAMDIVLIQSRPSLATARVEGALRVGVSGPSLSRARIRAVAKSAGAPADPDPLAQLAGDWSDTSEDTLLVSAVYVLSPENTDPAAPVDETWTPYAKHNLFWNLAYAHTGLPDLANPNDLTVPMGGLGGGQGAFAADSITAQQNADFAHAIDFITTKRITGKFWTV